MDALALLRPGLLDGLPVAVTGQGPLGDAVRRGCGELNASLVDAAQARALVVDGAWLFAAGEAGTDGAVALRRCVDGTWEAVGDVASDGFVGTGGGGRVVLLAPAPGAGERASAAVAALENLARTLSVEWARLGVTVVAVAPGEATAGEELAAVVAYLLSPAGAYYSGCLLDLRGG